MTDVSALTVEERLAQIEARLGVSTTALTPPITIGELTDVPAPGSQLAANWAQEASGRIVHRYANRSALDGWAAPAGTVAITLDDGALFRRRSSYWSRITPYTAGAGLAVGTSIPANTWTTIVSLTIPADPAPRIVDAVWHFRVLAWEPYNNQFGIFLGGVRHAYGQVPTVPGDGSGNGRYWSFDLTAKGVAIATGVAVAVEAKAYSTAPVALFPDAGDTALNKLSISAVGI